MDQLEKQASHKEEPSTKTPAHEFSTTRWISICVGLYLTAILYGLDTTIAANVQGPALASLGDIELLPWIGIGFPLGSVATILPLGILYSKLNVKWLYIASIILFEIGSAICGAAPLMSVMAFGRVVAGVGGAGMYLGCLNYVSILSPPEKQNLYTGLVGVFWGLGAILGPVIGGAFAISNATWRWSFYINLVLAAVTAPIYFLWFPSHQAGGSAPLLQRLRGIDWLGVLLNAAAYVLFLIACTFSGTTWAWNSGSSIALWTVTGVVVVALIVQQGFCLGTTKETRVFPAHLIKNPTLVLLFVATSCVTSAVFFPLYYVPLFFQFTKSDSAIQSAVRLLPYIFVFVACILLNGALFPVVGRYPLWYLLSGVLALIGSALMYHTSFTTDPRDIYGFEVLLAAGAGFTMQIAYSIASAAVDSSEIALAIGFINVAQLGSATLTLAVSGAIFQNIGFANLKNSLQVFDFTDSQLRDLLAGGQSSLLSNSDSSARQIALEAIAQTIATGYGLVIGASALLILTAVLMGLRKGSLAS